MQASSSVAALTSALVHQSSSSSPAVRRRHATFIAKRLFVFFAVVAVAPFFLAFHGAPSGAEALVFACGFAPLAAAVVAARTGHLALAHAVAALGAMAASLTLWLGLGAGAACAIAWLLAAQVEASLAGLRLVTRATSVAAALVVVALLVSPAGAAAAQIDPVFAALALAYGVLIAADGRDVAAADLPVADATPAELDGSSIWQTAAEMLDGAVLCCDAAGSVVAAPDSCEPLLGISAPELAGRGLFEHVHVTDRPAFLKAVADAAYGDATTMVKLRLRTSDPSGVEDAFVAPRHLWVELRARRTGTPVGIVVVLRNIEAAEAQAAESVAAQRSADDAIRSKDDFLANMSHELRTPLNAIIGFSEMLASRTLCPADAAKQRDYARIIHQSGQHLLSVVNSILDMSKIRSGTFEILAEPFDIVPLIDLCCEMVKLKADEGLVRIVRDYPSAVDEMVGDKRACKQILLNLLSNAVKFTPEHGEVTVSLRPDGNALLIKVSDSGVGIGATDLSRLGDPFFQARSSRSRPFEGTGLGLSVVRGLVGLHGGSIELESAPGKGTCVSVRLPLDHRIGSTRTMAPIETIARHRLPEPPTSLSDRRMKQIA